MAMSYNEFIRERKTESDREKKSDTETFAPPICIVDTTTTNLIKSFVSTVKQSVAINVGE